MYLLYIPSTFYEHLECIYINPLQTPRMPHIPTLMYPQNVPYTALQTPSMPHNGLYTPPACTIYTTYTA